MAQATEAQVRQLERILGEQFFLLVQAQEFRIGLARKFGTDNPAFLNFSNKYSDLVKKWIQREVKYEKAQLDASGKRGLIAQGKLLYNDFFYTDRFPKLLALVKEWKATLKANGMGIIPLIIWAVVLVIGAFTAQEIVDDITTTTEEKEALMQTTAKTISDLGLTPEQASALISQTQAEAGGSAFGEIGSLVKWGIVGFIALKFLEGRK